MKKVEFCFFCGVLLDDPIEVPRCLNCDNVIANSMFRISGQFEDEEAAKLRAAINGEHT